MPTSELEMLPEEILLKILRILPVAALTKVAQVSRSFQRVSYDPSLWKNVVFKSLSLCAGTLGSVLSRGTTKMHVFNCQFEKPFSLEEPPENGHELQYLRVKDYNRILSDEIQFIINNCRHLKDVVLEVPYLRILHCHCIAIAANNQLESINLGCMEMKFEGLMAILRSCRKLHTLVYGSAILMTSSEMSTLVNELSDQMKVIDVFRYNLSLADDHVATLVKNCPNLTDLNFNGCQSITVVSMHHLAKLHKLDNLNISECTTLHYNAITHLPRGQHLKTLWYTIDFN